MTTFIDTHRDEYGIEPICNVAPSAPSAYYEHQAREVDRSRCATRVHRDSQLGEEIRRVWEENFRVYGVRKVWRQLHREGIVVTRCTVARLMRTRPMKFFPQFSTNHARFLRPLGQTRDGAPSALQHSAHNHSSFVEEGGEFSVTLTGDYWVTADTILHAVARTR